MAKDSSPDPNRSLTIDTLDKLSIKTMLDHASIPWAIKDTESRYIYMNKRCMDFLNVPKDFDYEGKKDSEFPCEWAAMESEYTAQDRKAELSQDGAEIISISHYWRERIFEPYYSPKFAVRNKDNEILGTVYYAKKFNYVSIGDFFNDLKPSVISLTPPTDLFTERELEIIFYAIQRVSAKEIAPKLFISHRTVENRLLRIYEKSDTNSINGLIEYCHNVGLNNYVPKKLLREGVNFCW
ncbi:Putative transcriptional regulator, PAS and GerEdomains [Sodalis praecaptivus]|uniref:Putative transcriptional regulator, PAS and GerEdomains n=1 Tax=Sodalis praecaptivus TaxID=1239307 RepID=W0HVJ4_9GAMM|nr:PAS and helix-turn-helix domain-containing protein [Sodalis praecaptivus]AHF77876.1 Putative transcriptional regulator, PAS and GerEdomains [Sodalis praecaptivus]